MLKYIYDTGKIERDFVLKKVEGSCKQDPNHTKLIGVMCRTCPFYDGEKQFYTRNSEFLHGIILGVIFSVNIIKKMMKALRKLYGT